VPNTKQVVVFKVTLKPADRITDGATATRAELLDITRSVSTTAELDLFLEARYGD
jgi:hypothetical protein